jgi:DNA-binding MarR family transcriptional regulator
VTTEADPIAGVDRLGLVLARQGQAMNLRLRQALRTSSLSPRQGATLMHLATVGATSQQALLDALAIDPSALVAILNELEGGGLLHRSRDPRDRRRHTVEITPAGRNAIKAIEHAIAEVEREAFADLNGAEIATLHQLLARVRPRNDVCVEDC